MNKIQMSEERKGELYVISSNFFWGFFPIATILSMSTLNPMFSLSLNTGFATIFFFFVMLFQKKFYELKNYKAYKYILLNLFFVGILFYGFLFWGLSETNAGNVGIISQMEIFFSFIILDLIMKHQQSPRMQIIGALFMIIGASLVLFKGSFVVNRGDLIILIATIFPPLGNYYLQKVRKEISAATIMFVRSLLCSLLFFLISLYFNKTSSIDEIIKVLPWLMLNGFLLLGLSKIFWIEAAHRISIQKSVSFGTVAPLFTLIFAYFILGEIPNWWQILGFIPIMIGAILIMRK